MDNKFVNGTMLSNFAKKLKANIKSDLLGDKKLRYLTQAEYDALTDDEKNNENIIYNITNANIDGFATEDYVNNKLANLQIVRITKAEYEALTSKDPNTLYLITE